MSDDIFFNIPLDFGVSGQKMSRDEVIAFRKIYSKLSGKIEDKNSAICPICSQPIKSFCNSHSLPRFCLKQIADNGMVISPSFIFNCPIFESETGVAKAGTFHLICERCDHEAFSEYENPQNYFEQPSEKMLAQIALKTSLRFIYKRILEINMYQNLVENYPVPYLESALATSRRDYNDFFKDFKYAKKAIANSINPQYQIGYFRKLNYVIPSATQVEFILITDLNGCIINNIYNISPSYNLQPLHLCLFPLETSSIVLLFFKKGHNGLRKFCKSIKELTEYEQLQLISYMGFLYCEDIYMNQNIKELLKKYDSAKKTIETSSISMGFTENPEKVSDFQKISCIKKEFDLNQYKTFPNLLSEEFKIIKAPV